MGGEKLLLVKPQTYMNLSGDAIAEFAAFYKIPPQNIIIVHDDVSLDRGNIRIRPKGSDGGHNGLKSIIYRLSSDEFIRIKMGVGSAEHGDLANFVLGRFSKDEIKIMEDAIIRASEACEMIVAGYIDRAMNKFNSKNK
jgi:PTH1 family peptidyl-tRNA hydrolase